MYTYEKLENTDIQTLYLAFLDAFSDYQVKINLSLEMFQTLLKRKGFNPKISIGAFKEPEHELVGFVFNGMRNWQGKSTAYDIGTGITPSNRKKGISNNMLQVVKEALVENNIEQYLLEVIQDNKAAFELYKKQGFSIIRSFSCFNLNKSIYTPKASSYNIEYIPEIKLNQWEGLKSFWDFEPSWQNSIDCICAIPEKFVYAIVRFEDKIIGYGIVEKASGDIPQIAVKKEYRHKGVATSIIDALVKDTEAEALSIINVDDSCEEMIMLLEKLGFQEFARQYEMMLQIKTFNQN